MYLSVKLLSKRVANNLFVSNHCLRLNYFNSDKLFVMKNHLNLIQNYRQIQTKCKTTDQVFDINYTIKRCFSSKTNSSETEKQSKLSKNTKEVRHELSSEDESQDIDRDIKDSIKVKFKKYSDEDSEVIYDVSEEILSSDQKSQTDSEVKDWSESDQQIYLYQQKPRHEKTVSDILLTRGVTGVFDIQELVDLLRSENLKEIAVIEVPKELNYCQYLVLANATSKRHINAFSEYFNKVYKTKKHPTDPFLDFGGNDCPDWKVVDMKNIVLHLFLKPTRDHYDIETLWTVGHEFDDKIQRPESDSVVDIMEKHIKFLQEIEPKN